MRRSPANLVPDLVDASSTAPTAATTKLPSRESTIPSPSPSPLPSNVAAKIDRSSNETIWNGLGGLSHGSFFRACDFVDPSLRPGASPMPAEPLAETIPKIATGSAFLYSPNFTWFLMAVACWQFVPYDVEVDVDVDVNVDNSGRKLLRDALWGRLGINLCGALTYVGFWHWVLYGFGICTRPFVPNRSYRPEKVLHNAYYTVLGVVQWTLAEGAFLYLYRSGTLPFSHASSSRWGLLQTLLLSVAVPPYRDLHFYIAHRFLHLRFLYKYVHSLHHRTTDPEPFSGLAMHPVEHLYYYTCYGPLLVLPMIFPRACRFSPFLVFWMGFHVVLSPAASHSGYEDHFSASLNHYLHHRYCDCKYGAGIHFDALFGTYRDALWEATRLSADDPDPPPPPDPKTRLGIFPEHPWYELGTCGMVAGALLLAGATNANANANDDHHHHHHYHRAPCPPDGSDPVPVPWPAAWPVPPERIPGATAARSW
mmetsp:Transcript_3002/g.7193  ORF Transcript_3002/g.7193 Transcript_3002/m.7193 type:complete len:481 (+) Transcript_3002:606-2048(+)